MTRRPRITVTNDDELAKALERMRPFFPGKPAAALVHDLAIKGAVAVEEEEPGFFEPVAAALARGSATPQALAARSR